ncbi:hypothetical protein AMATHDRAFT_60602 [Amanita thiersii Skay4041]|uniref:Uncharacterized protein n=1 Tax=Amanita thiersii Skay4041 TaxID=703135 RepID=A0A2A9NSL0_9AGAR|nr:hypothetical protein AMATHDRAFT_60602 [Amanita thiersii Skay4041]
MVEATTVTVHRCRFVDHAPSAITSLAFPPTPLPPLKNKSRSLNTSKPRVRFGTLAIGHANGNIDLCEWSGSEKRLQSPQAWVIKKTLLGLYPSKVDSLAFIIRFPHELEPENVPSCFDLRLFSSGGGSELIEWDINRSSIRRTIGSHGGTIWCMAANPASTMLALGCEDGTVRLLSVVNDTLEHTRRFDRVKCRMLSIAWGPPIPRQTPQKQLNTPEDESSDEDDEDDWSDSWLVTGSPDSSLRKWDVATGRIIDRMGTDKIRGERTLVWTVGVLGDGTIVSGDSLGVVKFWDARTCTQLHSFKAHGADVLCLAIDPEGKAVYTAGVDQKVVQFTLVKTFGTDKGPLGFQGSSNRWIQAYGRRLHSHDIRALAIWPVYTPLPAAYRQHHPMDVAPVLASGGLDMTLAVTPAALPTSTIVKIVNPLETSTDTTFENSYQRRLAYSSGPSGTSSICLAQDANLLLCMREASLTVWRVSKKSDVDENELAQGVSGQEPEGRGWAKLLEMDLNVNSNLVASAISADGRWLVASDLFETKLFSLTTDLAGQLNPKRIRDFAKILLPHISTLSTVPSTGGIAFKFTPDSSKLIMTTSLSSYVLVIDLNSDRPQVLRRFDQHRQLDAFSQNRVIKGRLKERFNKPDVETEDSNGPPASDTNEQHDQQIDMSDSDNELDPVTPMVVNILRIAVSPDGQWLATSDDHMRTHIFNLDSMQHHCVLPSFPVPVQALTFDSINLNTLLMVFPDNSLHVYNVESRQFPTWWKDFSSSLPWRVTNAHDSILGATFDPKPPAEANRPQYLLLWGSTWICRLSLTDNKVTMRSRSKKRRREPVKGQTVHSHEEQFIDYKMITHYRPILFLDFLSNGELVIVERPLIDVLSTLPPPYFKPRYGAS